MVVRVLAVVARLPVVRARPLRVSPVDVKQPSSVVGVLDKVLDEEIAVSVAEVLVDQNVKSAMLRDVIGVLVFGADAGGVILVVTGDPLGVSVIALTPDSRAGSGHLDLSS